MVARETTKMEASACNSRNGWRSSPLPSPRCGRLDSVDDTWVSRVPAIVPCYNGRSLQIHEELVVNGLSAISIKHHKGKCNEAVAETPSDASAADSAGERKEHKPRTAEAADAGAKKHSSTELPTCLREKMKRRNSFWNMHRPELSKLTWPQNFLSSAMLRDFFHHHLRTHGTFCEPLHVDADRTLVLDEEFRDFAMLRELVPPMVLPPDEKAVNIMEKSRSVQLNDEDLDPEIMVHKSRAEFCVTIGEYVRKPLLKRSTSQQMLKRGIQSVGRFEQRDSLSHREEASADDPLVPPVVSDSSTADSVFRGESESSKNFVRIAGETLPGETVAVVSVEEHRK